MIINDTPYGCVEVFLDSSHGQRFNEYHNEVSFYFNETLVRVSQSYDLVLQVMSASIPLAYDNVDDDIDNTKLVVFKAGGMFSYDVDQTIELPNGNYNIKDLKSAINDQLAASTNRRGKFTSKVMPHPPVILSRWAPLPPAKTQATPLKSGASAQARFKAISALSKRHK